MAQTSPREEASLAEVARQAGVSVSTASRALAGYGRVSAATIERVAAVAEALRYRPNALARGLIQGSTRTVGVVVPDIYSAFFAQAVNAIIEVHRSNGYDVLLANTNSDVDAELDALRVMSEKRVDGVIVATAQPSNAMHLAAFAQMMPLVLLDRPVPKLKLIDTVMVANADSARVATKLLISAGHQRIGILTEAAHELPRIMRVATRAQDLRPSEARLAGYLRAHRDAGIEVDLSLVAYSPHGRDEATQAALRLLNRDATMTAIFATNGTLSAGTYRAIQSSGRAFPSEVSMVGFDDDDWTTMVRPMLTVVRQPAAQMGKVAAELLIDRMTSDSSIEHVVSRKVLPGRLVERDSVAARML